MPAVLRATARRCRRAAALAAALMMTCAATAQPSAAGKQAEGDEAVATIAGQPVTRAELEASIAGELSTLRQQRQDALEKGLDRYLANEVLTRESTARGVSLTDLLDEEVLKNVKSPTDAEVDAFYERNKNNVEGTKEQLAPRIREYLAQQRRQQALQNYVAALNEKYGVRVLLEPLRIGVDAGNSPSRGAANAPLTLVEFGDFQCPYCSRLKPTLEQAMKSYAGKVRLVFRQFPLSSHPDAAKAAEASLCAREQGKFWELHDRMYEHQNALQVADLKKAATALGLDGKRFGECLDSGRSEAEIKADVLAGQNAGVTGTPALFVNGRPVPGGAVEYSALAKVLDDELKRVGHP
jgi:protein-disulfide isomerase